MPTDVKVPSLGESVQNAVIVSWSRADGDSVKADEPICTLETDKANVDLPSPAAGVLRQKNKAGETVSVGQVIASIEAGNGKAEEKAPAKAPPPPVRNAPEDLSPAVRAMLAEHGIDPKQLVGTGPGGRITKDDVVHYLDKNKLTPPPAKVDPSTAIKGREKDEAPSLPPLPASTLAMPVAEDGSRRVPMTKLRRMVAERLVKAKNQTAMLTTVNEIDMSAVFDLRSKFKERFNEVHGVGLGFMSFFARAVVVALKEIPGLNSFIDGNDLIYHDYVNLGVAVSTERGLTVPVLRNAQNMSFARIENEIKRLSIASREGKLSLDELSGGTFTITNGGVFGSLLSTPILNPPESGILGMHAIQKRPVAINDKVEIRPMMNVALSYDHRVVDGREAVTFLVRVKQLVEDPSRLMLEI